MTISSQDFKEQFRVADKPAMHLVFIGMSNVGKSHHSKEVAAATGIERIEFDEIIGHSPELKNLVKDYPGKDMAEKLGNYFGMPWTDGFQGREDKFLEIEREFMAREWPTGSILDLTGSAIYHPEQMEKIARTGLIVYLETSAAKREELMESALRAFKESPKPVCWSGVFKMNPGETGDEALRRCYPQLQAYRAGEYAKYADVIIPYERHRPIENGNDFLTEIEMALR